jgi:hypothetical protein
MFQVQLVPIVPLIATWLFASFHWKELNNLIFRQNVRLNVSREQILHEQNLTNRLEFGSDFASFQKGTIDR